MVDILRPIAIEPALAPDNVIAALSATFNVGARDFGEGRRVEIDPRWRSHDEGWWRDRSARGFRGFREWGVGFPDYDPLTGRRLYDSEDVDDNDSAIDLDAVGRRQFFYTSTARFWNDVFAQNVRVGQRVTLDTFWLSEWPPLRPGLYHTKRADEKRGIARSLSSERGQSNLAEYVSSQRVNQLRRVFPTLDVVVVGPSGKASMIDGGVGSVRLGPKTTSDGELWFLGASSEPISHAGLIAGIYPSTYGGLIDEIASKGAISCTLVGEVRPLPGPLSHRVPGVPPVFVRVDEVQRVRPTTDEPFLATGAVLVECDPSRETRRRSYGEESPSGIATIYASFAPSDPESITAAAEWIAGLYARDVLNGRVITDFDEQIPRFADAPFSLARIADGQVERRHLREVFELCDLYWRQRQIFIESVQHLTIEELYMTESRTITIGAGATVSAPVVIADSIENSFRKVAASDADAQIKQLLSELVRCVAAASPNLPVDVGEQIARDVEAVTTELVAQTPRLRWARALLSEITDAARVVGDAALPIVETVERLAHVL